MLRCEMPYYVRRLDAPARCERAAVVEVHYRGAPADAQRVAIRCQEHGTAIVSTAIDPRAPAQPKYELRPLREHQPG